MSLYESFDFSKGGIGVPIKQHFPLKNYKEFAGTFFAGFFPGFFFLGQGEKYTWKKLAETQSMKIQV